MTLLHPGDAFPSLSLKLLHGDTLDLPGALAGDFGVVLVYRGAWCPYCVAQLESFERSLSRLGDAGARVVALSADDEAATLELITAHRLTFPVGHSADVDEVAGELGSFVNPDPCYLQSTGFLLDPDGNVVVSVYSSGPIGVLTPGEVIRFVGYLRTQG